MKKYLFIVLLVGVVSGSQRLNRTSIDLLNPGQSELRINDFRNEEELLNYIESTMETNFIPGLSISIAKGGSIVWNKHFGYANINENILVDENTKFILSSASKTITAAALMHLFEQNLFLLDDDIDNYLPFDINHPVYPEIPITFKMLLSHTSGIEDNWNYMPFYDGDSPLDLGYYLNQYFSPLGEFYDTNLNFTEYAPGTGFSYSNIGAALVGLLVEEISNQSFNEYCIENIFEPLGMSDAYWFLSEIENLNEVALPHQLADGSTDSLVVLENYGYSDYPAGQLRTTSNNLAKFMSSFINNGVYNGVEILSPETIELMKTIHYPNVAYDQGLIWYYKTLNERTLFGHGGSDKGSLTEMFISFSDNIGVVLLSNSRNHEGMAQIENAVFNYAVDADFTTSLNYECIATDSTDGTLLWGNCYSILNTDSLFLREIPINEPIPSNIGDLVNLVYLNLRETQIYGQIPTSIGNLSALKYLDMSLNNLDGEIIEEIWSLTNLEWLNLRGNSLTGEISPSLSNLSDLKALALYENNLTGSIPSELGSLTNLIYLHLNNNSLTGSIPSELGNLANLIQLILNDNALTGSIPSELGGLTNLIQLFLFNNQLSGLIPSEMCNISNIHPHYYNNQLCPPYPSCIEFNLGEHTQDTTNCQISMNIFANASIPNIFSLHQNYPNPFNPFTSLRYDLPNDGLVNITIYDITGRIVKTLVNSSQTAGHKLVRWNATNDRNEPVSAGIYLYTIQADGFRHTKKMVLLK
ncbi:MAG: serine hydrolase [Candidatus Neomarinimicrobiota bacterium]